MTTETREHIARLERLADAAQTDGRWKTAQAYARFAQQLREGKPVSRKD